MEIERKFLLKQFPNIPATKEIEIYQGYISISPEVRIRSYEVVCGTDKGHKDFTLTIKGEGSLAREEIETYVSQDFFKQTSIFLRKPLIHKRYVMYEHNGFTLECSVVDEGAASSFIYGEVEFDSIDEAEAYKWPFAGAEDVTLDKQYKMKNYWLCTR